MSLIKFENIKKQHNKKEVNNKIASAITQKPTHQNLVNF